MSVRPFYEIVYHVEGWTLADAFRPQPGWGTRTFTVKASDLGEHTTDDLISTARLHAPPRHRLTSVSIYPEGEERRVLWSTLPDPRLKNWNRAAAGAPGSGKGRGDGAASSRRNQATMTASTRHR